MPAPPKYINFERTLGLTEGMHLEKYYLLTKIYEPDQQTVIKEIFQNIEKEFPYVKLDSRVTSKKLTPLEITLEIAINFGTGVASVIILKCLEKLWDELKQNRISPETQGLDAIQKKAQEYLKEIGSTGFEILKRENRGPYVAFTFKDGKGQRHYLKISSSDLKVIEYTKR